MPKKSLFVILFKIFKNKKKRKFSLSFWPKKNLGTCVTKKIACSNPQTICIQIWTCRDFLVSKNHLFFFVCVDCVCGGGYIISCRNIGGEAVLVKLYLPPKWAHLRGVGFCDFSSNFCRTNLILGVEVI